MRWKDVQDTQKLKNNILYILEAGTQDFSGGATAHTWDTERIPSSYFLVPDNGDRVMMQLNSGGHYKITFEGSFNASTESEIQISGNAVNLGGAKAKGECISITIIQYLEMNDYIQVISDGGTSIANSCRLIVEKI